MSRDDGQAMLDARASLLQIYTGYIYEAGLPRTGRRAEPADRLQSAEKGAPDQPYGERLAALVTERGPLCVGVDPHPSLLASWGLAADAQGLERCARGMIEALGGIVPVFKPQSAFFEAYGAAGIAVLERTLADIKAAGAISLLDVKRGDIGSTMDAYAAAYLSDGSPLAADAVTLNPYLGFGSWTAPSSWPIEAGAASTSSP